MNAEITPPDPITPQKGGFWKNLFMMILGTTISLSLTLATAAVHNRRCWLHYAADCLRFYNRKNMSAIGIPEKEVMEYTDSREEQDENESTPPSSLKYYTNPYNIDDLTTLRHLANRIEELKAEK